MSAREDAYVRHQQARWLRPDAHRWIRADAARYLKPGTDIASVFPPFESKYSASQPRVPAGNSDGGQWTSGGGAGGGVSVASPMGHIDFGDLPSFSDLFSLFQITPSETDFSGTQLAGDIPTGDSPETPSNEPPEIPKRMPVTRDERMGFVRAAAEWVRVVGRYTPVVGAYFEALDQIGEINRLTAAIKTANDPPRNLQELQDRVHTSRGAGYEKHHTAEESAARDAGDPESLIQGRDNLVLVPTLKHIEISRYYSTKVEQPDGSMLSPRDQLRNQDFETRRQYGLKILRDYGVLE
ncbi:MAG: hypothetical protein V4661_02350 [Pseudomonadota bacterium]